jgi:hypothetical protein
VANPIADTMVHGRWKRAASTMASNCVLSPISLTAIVAAGIRKSRVGQS